MSLLLDTQIAVLAVSARDELTSHEHDVIQSYAGQVFVSLVSLWEIAIKNALRPRKSGFPF